MATHFAISKDTTRIAYDATGSGPAVMLLHGGGQDRRVWQDAGSLNLNSLSLEDRVLWQNGTPLGAIPVTFAWLSAMLDWPVVEPAELRCPTLWLVGTANENAMPSVKEYSEALGHTKVVLQLVLGVSHERELLEVEEVLPSMVKFMQYP